MKRKTFNILLVLGFALLLVGVAVGVSRARVQASVIQKPSGPQASVDTAFTYQGRLTDSSSGDAVAGPCDFQFGLYDAATGGSSVGSLQTITNKSLNNGYFSVELDFGDSAFQGDARYLQIGVRCPAGSGSYTSLGGRVALTAAPYAHSLRPGAKVSGGATSGSVLQAVSSATTGDPAGLYGEASSSGGAGVAGWNTSSSGGYAVYGNNTASSGTPYGVYGLASNNGSATSYGVYGKSNSSAGTGVGGIAPMNGVYGEATGSGVTYGVYGKATSSSGYAIYSEGNAHIEGDLTWVTRTSYIAVSAAAFNPMEDGYDYINQGEELWNNDGSSDHYAAPIQLPHGATVSKMTFYWWDGSSGADGHCTMYRTTLTGTEVVVAEAWTDGNAATADSSEDNSIVYATVDNSQYSYYLYWDLPDMVVAGYGVVIEYKYTETY